MQPESSDGSTFWEHVCRYRFAARHVHGLRVLDIACGEGYGSDGLRAADAAQVIGVDVCEKTCAHARDVYGLDARIGRAEAIPLPDASVDVVVSFETIEHLVQPQLFLAECARVLAIGGRLIISTPNRPVYHRERAAENPYHHCEMTAEEFRQSLEKHFTRVVLHAQCLSLPAFWQLRVVRRLVTLWRRFTAPHVLRAPTASQRGATRALISSVSAAQERHDPFRVRPACSTLELEDACYLVAVAHKN